MVDVAQVKMFGQVVGFVQWDQSQIAKECDVPQSMIEEIVPNMQVKI